VLYHAGMTDQLSLIVLVVALATGLVTSIVVTTYVQARQPVFFRYFLTNILLFNLLILAGLVFRYLMMQLQNQEMQPHLLVLPGLLVIMAILKLGWLYAFALMNTALPADIVSRALKGILARAGTFIFILYVVITGVGVSMHHAVAQQAAVIFLESLILVGAVVSTSLLMLTALKLPKGSRHKSVLVFGAYHLGLMGIILTVLIVGWLQPGPQRLAQLLANGGFLILFNIFPLIWIRGFSPLQPISDSERFESLGITRREREIISLVQTGKTNQEIADELFISVATVKDHNHNIFKKTGVRNRLELAQLFQPGNTRNRAA